MFIWSSFRQVIEEYPNSLETDRLHFDLPELKVGVNVNHCSLFSVNTKKNGIRPFRFNLFWFQKMV